WTELTVALPSAIAYWVPRILAGIVVLLLFLLFTRAVARGIKATLSRTHVDDTLSAFITNVVRYVLVTIGIITALGQMGVDTTSLLASLGVVGLTIGFAAQDTVSNVISGIFLFWDRPFVIGDLVEVDGKYDRVDEITLRS